MTRTTLILSLIIVALLGGLAGLGWFVGEQRFKSPQSDASLAFPPRLGVQDLVVGSCVAGDLQLDPARMAEHFEALAEDIELTAAQQELASQLILSRAQVACTVQEVRAELRAQDPRQGFEDPAAARAFLDAVLNLRETLSEASLSETRLQRRLLESFSSAQLQDLSPRTLPRLVPGLSLREFLSPGQDRRPGRPYR